MKKPVTTCQICGRPIKANTGVIAHHGYKRPGGGWQTSSCMGARHLPYEVSCDLIPVAIEAVNAFIERQTAALTSLMTNPPEQLTKVIHTGSYSRGETITVDRPEGFDPLTSRRTYMRKAYDTIFFERKNSFEGQINSAKNDLEYLTQRLEAWVAPAAEVTEE